MDKKINFGLLALIFVIFGIAHFTEEISNYNFWIIIFLFWIAKGVNKP
jgi:predicted membrane protein